MTNSPFRESNLVADIIHFSHLFSTFSEWETPVSLIDDGPHGPVDHAACVKGDGDVVTDLEFAVRR